MTALPSKPLPTAAREVVVIAAAVVLVAAVAPPAATGAMAAEPAPAVLPSDAVGSAAASASAVEADRARYLGAERAEQRELELIVGRILEAG
jgi:hypothetical protein